MPTANRHPRRLRGGALLLAAAVLAACGGAAGGTFSPIGSCVVEGREAGAYPDLEARLPQGFAEPKGMQRPPTMVDSGRSCSPKSLGSIAQHGVTELRFAGATWDEGNGNATVSAVFVTPDDQPRLEPAWVEEFYESSARASKKTENIETSRPTMGSAGAVFRLDTLNDLSLQTVVVWPSGDVVRVAIIATTVRPDASRAAHEQRVELAVETSEAAPRS